MVQGKTLLGQHVLGLTFAMELSYDERVELSELSIHFDTLPHRVLDR